MSRTILIILCVISFAIGVYAWRVQRTGRKVVQESSEGRDFTRRSTLVVIGGTPVTVDDVDFEYDLMTIGVKQGLKPDVTGPAVAPLIAIPDFSGKVDQELSPLKQRIATQIIERKLLYKFIEQDKNFDIQDPGKFSRCLKEWDDALKASPRTFVEKKAQERLKKLLCEKSLITQYLQTVITPKLRAQDQEIAAYYAKNSKDFRTPPQVVIRQIVVSTENDAKAVKRELNRGNFSFLASQRSIAPEKDQGGLLPPFAQGSMPQLFDIAFSMRPGEIRGILKSTYGFHFVMLERNIPRQELNLAEATPKIRNILTLKLKEEAYQKWVDQALNSVTVVTPKPLW